MNSFIEIFGIIATIILVVSMAFNCKTKKATLIMRTLNAVSAIMFIVYSIVLNAYSSILSNLAILIIDIFWLYKCIFKER
jgi:hypothetical protein